MNIGFDAKRLFNNFTGLGNYSRFIVKALREGFPEDQLLLYTPRIKKNAETRCFLENHEVIAPPPIIRFKGLYDVWKLVSMPFHPSVKRLDIFHGLSHELPYFLPPHIKKIVTVHDLIFIRYPQFYQPFDVWMYKKKLISACQRADRIVAVSQQTASDLTSFLNVKADRISIVHQGCHPMFYVPGTLQEKETVKAKYNLPPQYILNVGTIEERKNLLQLCQALKKLKMDIPLVVVGKKTSYFRKVREYLLAEKLDQRVIFIHAVDFKDLPFIYQMASVFVYPSLFEGFGIPIIEAMASKVPVIVLNASCSPEIAGNAALLVEAHNPDRMADAIHRVLQDESLRGQLIEKGNENMVRFSPGAVANALHQIYREMLNK